LRQALRETRRSGIAKFILRDVQHLAAIEVIADGLTLSTLRFADELVDTGSLDFPRVAFKKQELDMAKRLVQSLAGEWQPGKYTDDYRDNLMKVIKAKMRGKSADLVSEQPARDSKVVDLMERLKRSIEASAGRAPSAHHSRHARPEKAESQRQTRRAGSRKRQGRQGRVREGDEWRSSTLNARRRG
jgi:DNA end-binding protein Ku